MGRITKKKDGGAGLRDLLFIFLYAGIVGIVIEIAVVLFAMTGLKRTIARFQVISMLTGTGFTTDESSLIIDHPIRRRLSAAIILFGYFSLAVIISSIAALLVNNLRIRLLAIVITLLLILIALLKNRFVYRFLEKKFEHHMDEQFNLEDWPLKTALKLEEEDSVALLEIHHDSPYVDRPSHELFQEIDDVHLLFIRRGDHVLRKRLYEEHLQSGDKVLIFGDAALIEKNFSDMLSEDDML